MDDAAAAATLLDDDDDGCAAVDGFGEGADASLLVSMLRLCRMRSMAGSVRKTQQVWLFVWALLSHADIFCVELKVLNQLFWRILAWDWRCF